MAETRQLLAPFTAESQFEDAEKLTNWLFYKQLRHTTPRQATLHHGIKEMDKTWHQLQDACIENWLGSETKTQLLSNYGCF